ncbi:Serine/threonine-protein kinase PknA [Nonomuraea coxensis DSM 45129]|uniref:non-specific serine/threonine protein kinase n=1 Tax=Nonomuraea coxensis DSM 45129 TaxID=1122611 RepID=A0ABX8TRK4_9ACTN|nr:serine/threonine-protein kinase [Nonomuraea coxensis]QYC37748.1 Serine/threonine-protein kinase PknA [Nonomuraea coxensis DSM 45129]
MRLRNRYLLVSRIATGGMGEVWRARDELLGREVAVKILRSHIHVDPAFRERFRNEARITASLADPGIAQVFDYGEQSDLSYLVMELVHGEPLSAILARNGAIGAEVTLDVVHQTARALQTAHAAGVIHRDVKPGNLLVTPEGVIKVTDFGIARALEAAPVTQTGTVLGTAQYVSPEQAQGFPLTPATDLYSLGVVAYECLAGRTPFQGDNHVAIALRHLNEAPRPLGVDVPGPVRELVMELLAKDPGLRPGTATAVADRAYVLRESLAAAAGQPAELSMLTDPGGFRVRESSPEDQRETDDLVTPTEPAGPATGREPARRRRGARTLAVVATAGCVAAVGLSAMTLASRTPPGTATPGTSEPTRPMPSPAQVRPSRTKTRTHRPPVIPIRSSRPTPSRSATVSTSATPTRKPTPKPTPTTRTPTPTPTTPKPTTTLTTPTPPASPDQGATNPPEEET